MGGPGSGRQTNEQSAAAKRLRTPETAHFLEEQARQNGDRLFKVKRVYPSGNKATLGNVFSASEDVIGAQFGGGVYEIHELERATETETGKIVKVTLHPSTYPYKKKFQKDPHEMDLDELAQDRAGGGPSPEAGGLAGLSREEMYLKARADARAEFEREQAQRDTQKRLADLDAKLERMAAGDFGPASGKKTPMEEMAAMFDLFKKIMPPPAPFAGGGPQLSPTQQLQESMELIKNMRGALKEIGGEVADGKITPMGEKLISSLLDLGQRGFNAWERTQGAAGGARGGGQVIEQAPGWAQTHTPAAPAPAPTFTPPAPTDAAQAAGAGEASQVAGWALTRRRPATATAAPAASAAPSSWPKASPNYTATRADFGTQAEWEQYEADAMTYELVEFTKKEMNGLIAGKPGFSIFKTAEQIRGRWLDPKAAAPWLKLRDGIRTYTTEMLVEHFSGLNPELCPTPRHRDCLAALIDVIKEREGVKS